MDQIHALIELLILFQNIDTGMNNDPAYPAFKRAPVLEAVDLREDLL